MRVIALIEKPDIVERNLKHLNRWHPEPEHPTTSGPDPPWPKDTNLPLEFHPVPDIA